MRYKPSPHLFHHIPHLLVILATLLGLGLYFIVPAQAISAVVATPVTLASSLANQPLNPGGASCTYVNTFYAAYMDATNGKVYLSTSPDGVAWTPPTNIFTMINLPSTGNTLISSAQFSMGCENGAIVAAWADSSHGAGDWRIDYEFCGLSLSGGAPACAQTVNGPVRGGCCTHNDGGQLHLATTSSVLDVKYLNGHVLIVINNQLVSRMFIEDNIGTFNTTSIAAAGDGIAYTGGLTGTYVVASGAINAATWQFMYSGDFVNWNGPVTVSALNGGNQYFGASLAGNNGMVGFGGFVYAFILETHVGGACVTASCLVLDKIGITGAQTHTVVGDIVSTTAVAPIVSSDAVNAIVAITATGTAGGTSGYAVTNNLGGSWTFGGFTSSGSTAQGGGAPDVPFSVGPYFSTALNAFSITSVSTTGFSVFTQVFGVPISQIATAGTQTIGSCPAKNTATFTMVNQTLYLYEGTTLANQAVNTVQVNIASVGGVTGTHTVQLVIYATPSPGAISPSNLFTLLFARQVSLTSGTKNVQIIMSVVGVTFPTAGATWSVGVVGDNKIALNQSSLGGMFSYSGVPVSTALQNSFYTTQGSAFGTDLALCANSAYQIVQTTTVTQTVTSISTTGGGTATTTVTSTATSLDSNIAMTTSTSYVLIIIMLLGPAVILGAVGALTKSAALTGGLFIGGLAIGAGAGNLSGIIPFNILALVVIVMVFLILALVMVMTRGGGGGGGV